MIAIHFEQSNNFSVRWKEYCDLNNIPYKIVSCYDSDIIEQVKDCKALLWHVNNYNYKDQIFAKYLIKSLENLNIKVFPDYNTVWHFDDKVAQKYLLESAGVPFVKTDVFYDKKSALEWIKTQEFPKVFKLRKGSGSKGVRLVKSKDEANKLINTAFSKGFKTLSMWFLLQERFRKYKLGKDSLLGVLKGIARLLISTNYVKMAGREIGYIYFQEFLPKNKFDIRIIVIGDKAFAIKRMVREGDFRASGSGHIIYDNEQIDLRCVRLAFESNNKLNAQCLAYDFVYDENNNPLIIEISFGFNQIGYHDCPGYWDEKLVWHETKIVPQDWMIEGVLKTL